jgi:hypothetical protein
MESRQQRLEQALNNLDQDFDQIEAEAIQTILSQNALWYENLAAMIEEAASDSSNAFTVLSKQFTEEMRREREHYRRDLYALVQQYGVHAQKEQRKEQVARQWLHQAVMLADFIREQFDHEQFLPGRLLRILQNLEFAQNNLAQGLPEASLQVSQQVFLELSDLHFELEHRLLEWQVEFEKTCTAFKEALAGLISNSQVNALGLQGEELAEKVDLDYWTYGKHHQLMEKCRQVLELLAVGQQRISIDELRRLNSETLPAISQAFESSIYEARLKALNSQLRMNIAERALQALENQGFNLADAGYIGEDMRAPFTAHLENSDGSRVTIQVLPSNNTNQELTNDLVVVTSHPSLKTGQEARSQWEALCSTLTRYNLNVGRPDIRTTPPAGATEQTDSPLLLPPQRSEVERQKDVR